METIRVLVTGAAGFMGSWICKYLIKEGYSDIYGIDDLSGGEILNIDELIKNNKMKFCNIDLSDSIKTENTIADIRPEIVFHLAASAREGASFFDPVKMVKTNYMAYMNTLESCIKTGSLNKVILFSSMAVYGSQSPPFDEILERRPEDVYAINKAAMERSTELLSDVHSFEYVIIRPHNVMGEYQSMRDKYRNVVTIMANRVLRGEPIYIYGDGKQQRAFSYIKDSLPCYINAMTKDKVNGEIINIGGKIPITINRLAEIICNEMECWDYPIEYLPERFGEVKEAWCTVDKSEKLLGYKENIGYEKGIKNTVKWTINQGPKEWVTDKLALFNDKAPRWWA